MSSEAVRGRDSVAQLQLCITSLEDYSDLRTLETCLDVSLMSCVMHA